ncbi:hypothetical protein [Paraburkholderia bannensis]|uniref:hypothetical protein n=1 Tax=Paraburkholderia bannensis TaxID=765414 RepID=UPI002AB79DD2|nr:hypothetical protein [Paraburkholderia bannensis]
MRLGAWFVDAWQPAIALDGKTGRRLAFHDASGEQLESDPACWVLRPVTILFRFSIGVTNGKRGTLVNAPLDFKLDDDASVRLTCVLPHLAAA